MTTELQMLWRAEAEWPGQTPEASARILGICVRCHSFSFFCFEYVSFVRYNVPTNACSAHHQPHSPPARLPFATNKLLNGLLHPVLVDVEAAMVGSAETGPLYVCTVAERLPVST